MRKVALFYNPLSGPRMADRQRVVEEVALILRQAGKEVLAEPTRGPGTAAAQVRDALAKGCETVIIAGGDGTINDALQGLAGGDAVLGVIPMGTGNVLAHDLGISQHPASAVRQLLRFQQRRIALGRVEFTDHGGQRAQRWFVAVAGVGGSAKLMYDVHGALKGTHGMAAYYFQMARLALFHPFAGFNVEYRDAEGNWQKCAAVEADAVRINNFGGLMRRWAWGAELQRDDAQLVLFRDSSRSRFLHYTLSRMLGARWQTPGIDMVFAREVVCTGNAGGQRLYAEVDGEYIGGPPVKIEIVPNMLNLLMSEKA